LSERSYSTFILLGGLERHYRGGRIVYAIIIASTNGATADNEVHRDIV